MAAACLFCRSPLPVPVGAGAPQRGDRRKLYVDVGVNRLVLQGTVNAEGVGMVTMPRGLLTEITAAVQRAPQEHLVQVDGVAAPLSSHDQRPDACQQSVEEFLFTLVTPKSVQEALRTENGVRRSLALRKQVALAPRQSFGSLSIRTCSETPAAVRDALHVPIAGLKRLFNAADPLQKPLLERILALREQIAMLQSRRNELQPLVATARLQQLLRPVVSVAEVRESQQIDQQLALLGQQLLELSLRITPPMDCPCPPLTVR